MRLAYLTTRYPKTSHTFIRREVEELRNRGVQVETFTIWRAGDEQILSQADAETRSSTTALLPPDIGTFSRGHVRALVRAPVAWGRTLAKALATSKPGLRGRALGFLWFMQAIVLWDICERRSLRHIHVHFADSPAAIAKIAVIFAREAHTVSAQTWSLTVHGPVEFGDPLLAEKVKAADFVVCISEFARSQVMALLPEATWRKLHVVHCGIDPDVFTPKPGHHGRAALEIVSVGRLVPVKGQAVMVEALGYLRELGLDARLTLIGDGPSREALGEAASRFGVTNHITWLGALAHDAIPGHLRRADVFCLPSFAEGVPVVLMEAMACALPVVATRIAGIPELVQDGVHGYVTTPGSAREIADAISGLASEPSSCESMGAAGRRRVVADFNALVTAAELEAVFRHELLGACC